MAEFRPSLRLALGLAVVIVGLAEAQSLVRTLRSQARLRDRLVRQERQRILETVGKVAKALEAGGPESWMEATRALLRSSPASEIELLDAAGHLIWAHPRPSPATHTPTLREMEAIASGSVLTVGPLGPSPPRLLTYAAVRSGGPMRILRLSTPATDLMEDLAEGRKVIVGHGVALVALVLAGGLALFPARSETVSSTPQALIAYEEAMERLRARGQEMVRQHEAERRQLAEHIEDKDALARAGELTVGIVHEVRNGLSTILGYARLLEKEATTDEATETAHRVREECETLEAVIRRFMEFVKRETLNLGPFELGRMLARVAARESRSRPGAEVSLQATGSQDDAIVGDEELLERAFENLVRNAREAAGVGGHVVVRVDREGDERVVRIADDGPGLPPEARRVLRPFLTTKAGGLGLGLPIALKIVHLHQGELEIGDSRPRGAVVVVRLPAGGPSP